jgi:Ricin-type beta-trefoil lectin domain-like
MKAFIATGQRSKGDASYDPVSIGKPQTPYLIRGLEATFDVLFALVLGKGTDLLLETEKHEPRSVTFVNKFSGKALEVENSSVHQGARIQQVTLSGAASQHWFVRFTKFIRCRTIPSTIGRQAQRFWAAFLRFPAAGYSLVADHSGLCLDIPSGLVLVLDVADNSLKNYATVWQYPLNGGDSQRWQLLK